VIFSAQQRGLRLCISNASRARACSRMSRYPSSEKIGEKEDKTNLQSQIVNCDSHRGSRSRVGSETLRRMRETESLVQAADFYPIMLGAYMVRMFTCIDP
jgi:hypothetical protein